MIKKELVLGLVLMLFVSFSSALSLEVSSDAISDTIINDAGDSAVFEFSIKNNGNYGKFEIFTFERFDLEPNEFSLLAGESTNLKVKFYPRDTLKENVGSLKVPVFFREVSGSETVQKDIFIELVDFDNAFDLKAENVNPEADALTLTFYNIEDISYSNIKLLFSSNFFKDRDAEISLGPFEKKVFSIPISKSDFKQLVSGTYSIRAKYTIDGRTSEIEAPVKLLENSGLSVTEENNGFIVNVKTINKHNEGNIPVVADIAVSKNIISRLFTSFSVDPQRVERDRFNVDYFWQKELGPDESLSVKVTTNWIFPLVILVFVIAILYLFNLYTSSNVIVQKKVSFVKTKGGEFALKVTLKVKARKFVQKLALYDRLPPMAQLYNQYGDSPKDFNKASGKLQWDIGYLGDGEERVFSYIIYSKMKVIGKFELPSATAMYEIDGKLHESRSNRAFFINEPSEIREE